MKIRCKYCYYFVDEDEVDDFLYEIDIEKMKSSINKEIKRLEHNLNLSNPKWKEWHEKIINSFKEENYKEFENEEFYHIYFDIYEQLFENINKYNNINFFKDKILFNCPICKSDMILDDLRYYPKDNINSTLAIEKNTIIEQDNLFQDKEERKTKLKKLTPKSTDDSVSLTELIKNDSNAIKFSDELESTNLLEEKNLKLKEQIPKHKKETTQYDEELDPDIITDEEEYKQNYIEKIKEDIKEFDNAKQNEIIKEIIIVTKKSTDKKSKELRESIKNYLMNTYKGYCQVCGFSFRKIVDGKNSFEMFNWNDKRIVKQKKSFITNADSLCFCRNCSANIKWGAFDPIFIDKINNIDGFAHKSVDEIKDLICVKLEDEVVDRFKDNYEWEDIYALEITVNDEPKNIYMTNGHLIQFIAYLQLEERV